MNPLRINPREPRRSGPPPGRPKPVPGDRQTRRQDSAAPGAQQAGSAIAARFEAAGLSSVPQLLSQLATLLLRNETTHLTETTGRGAGQAAPPPAESARATALLAETVLSESESLRLIDETLELLGITAGNRSMIAESALKDALHDLVQRILRTVSRESPEILRGLEARIVESLASGNTERLRDLLGELEARILDRSGSLALLREQTGTLENGRQLLELVRALGEREDPPFFYSEIAWRIGKDTVPLRFLAEWERRNGGSEVSRIIIDLEMSNLGRVRCDMAASGSRLDLSFTVEGQRVRDLFAAELGDLAEILEQTGFSVSAAVAESTAGVPHLLNLIFPRWEGEPEEGVIDIHA